MRVRLDPSHDETIIPSKSAGSPVDFSAADEKVLQGILKRHLRYDFGYGYPMRGASVISGEPDRTGWIVPETLIPARRAPDDIIERVAATAAIVLPLGLLYSRSGSEILIAVIDVLFLAHCAIQGRWSWLRNRWAADGVCVVGLDTALLDPRILAQSGAGRMAFLGSGALDRALFSFLWRRWQSGSSRSAPSGTPWAGWFAACAGWIVVQSWQQYLLGANIFGEPRWVTGALTGAVSTAHVPGRLWC